MYATQHQKKSRPSKNLLSQLTLITYIPTNPLSPMTISPITPEECIKVVPEEVIQVFNELIQKNWDGKSSTVLQKEVVALLSNRLNTTVEEIYKRKYLDVENIYEASGWKVFYEKCSYGDVQFDSYFEFTKPRK